MLVIRMQRTGRSGHAQFRVVVQDSRRTPTSGKIVAQVGSYNPHSKQTILNKEKAQFYLDHGAQPSPRVARLLKAEGVKLPSWVKIEEGKKREVRLPDKRRSTRPPEPVEEAPAEAPAEEPAAENNAVDAETAPAEAANETAADEASEAPAEEAPEATATEDESPVAEEGAEVPAEAAAEAQAAEQAAEAAEQAE